MQSPTKKNVHRPSMTMSGKSLCGMDGSFLGGSLPGSAIPKSLCDEGLFVPWLTGMGWYWWLSYTSTTFIHIYIITMRVHSKENGENTQEQTHKLVVPVSWTPSPVHPPWAIEKVPQVVRALFNSLWAMSCRTTMTHWWPESLPTPVKGQGRTMTHLCSPCAPDIGAVTFRESGPLAIDTASW